MIITILTFDTVSSLFLYTSHISCFFHMKLYSLKLVCPQIFVDPIYFLGYVHDNFKVTTKQSYRG